MKTYQELKQLISEQEKRVQLKLCTLDYAKGYCMGVLSEQTSESISEDEYNELSALVDDTFDTSQSHVNIQLIGRVNDMEKTHMKSKAYKQLRDISVCENCGSENIAVHDTRMIDGIRRRRRICRDCGNRTSTHEIRSEDLEKLIELL